MHPPPRSNRAYAAWVIVLLLGVALAALTLRPADAQDGELSNPAVFTETTYANNYAECHGADGTGAGVPGTDREGPSLVDRDDITTAYVDLVLRTGRMRPPGDPFDNRARRVVYSDAERAAIVAWTADVFDLRDDMPDVGEGDVARGLELFALNCAHCHGNTGAGGTAGQDVWTPQIKQLEGDWHVLTNPLDIPLRAAMVIGTFSFVLLASANATNDILSRMMGVPIETLVSWFRVTMLLVPPGLAVGLDVYCDRRVKKKGARVATNELEAQSRFDPSQLKTS